MLLFQKRFHEGLVSGAVTVTFRRWDRPHVRAGGRYRCHPIGVLEVLEVTRVPVAAIDDEDARRAGFADRTALLAYVESAKDGPIGETIVKVVLRHGGDGDRTPLALETAMDPATVEDIRKRLERLDRDAPWTTKTLALIEKHPRVAASKLAAKLGRDTLPFKVDVRKLKKLGLTQSFEVGYEISPRGRAFLDAKRKRRR